jgi:hypothetical protein
MPSIERLELAAFASLSSTCGKWRECLRRNSHLSLERCYVDVKIRAGFVL